MTRRSFSNEERFEAKYIPEPNSGCWLWFGASLPKRGSLPTSEYGRMLCSKTHRVQSAHRISYELHRGEIPPGMHVLHRCDQPCCVNPDHLFLGTQTDNRKDMASKGRFVAARGIKNGSAKLTDDMVREIRRSSESAEQLARRFGITFSRISSIRRRATWKHVE